MEKDAAPFPPFIALLPQVFWIFFVELPRVDGLVCKLPRVGVFLAGALLAARF